MIKKVFLLPLLLGSITSYAQDSSSPFVNTKLSDAVFGDIDNDGDQDLIVCGVATPNGDPDYQNLGNMHIYRNDGGNFTLDQSLCSKLFPRLDLVDLDGDNYLDLFYYGEENLGCNKHIMFIKNDGNGNFDESSATTESLPYIYYSAKHDFGDIDGDGDLDLLMTDTSTEFTNEIYLNDGTGFFTKKPTNNLSDIRNGFTKIYDFDNDSDLDIVLFGYDSPFGDPKAILYKNDGNGNFEHHFTRGGTINGFCELVDVNGDGFDELFYTGVFEEEISTGFIKTQGSASIQTNFYSYKRKRGKTAFGDLNGDNKVDIIANGLDQNGEAKTAMGFGNGNGTFDLQLNTIFDDYSFGSVDLADVDNDGDLDVFMTGKTNELDGKSTLYLNNGFGQFTVSQNNIGLAEAPYQLPITINNREIRILDQTAIIRSIRVSDIQNRSLLVADGSSRLRIPSHISGMIFIEILHQSGRSVYKRIIE